MAEHGHEFTEANTYRRKGTRICRQCNRDRQRRCAARRKALVNS